MKLGIVIQGPSIMSMPPAIFGKSMRTVRINEPLNCACPLMIWIKPWLMDIQICGI
jgi:hypothetical protein